MLKVLYVTNIPAPYRVDFWNELGKYVDLTVWFEAVNYKERQWDIVGLGNNFKYEFLDSYIIKSELQINPGVIKKIRKSTFDCYILSCYNTPTEASLILWFNKHNIPFILTSDGGFPKEDFFIKKMIKQYLISSARLWLSSGSNCTKYFLHYGANKDSIIEYPFTVDYQKQKYVCDAFEKEKLKKSYNLNKTVILTVGQFIHRKGIDILLKAFKNIDTENVSLLIIGSGNLKTEYLKFISENKLSNVLVLDFLQKDELSRFYMAADIFVLPTREDIWGLVINEAMNHGLPVITTNRTGSAADLVKNDVNGFIVDVDDINMLSEKLELLIQDEAKRKEFSEKSLRIIGEYTIENMVERYLYAIKNITIQRDKL